MVAEVLPNTSACVFMMCLFYWCGQDRSTSWVEYVLMAQRNACCHVWAGARLWRQFNHLNTLVVPGGYIGLYSLELAWLSLQRVVRCCRHSTKSGRARNSIWISWISGHCPNGCHFFIFCFFTFFGSCDSNQEIHSWPEFIQLGPLQASLLQCWSINLYSHWKDSVPHFFFFLIRNGLDLYCDKVLFLRGCSSWVGGSSSEEFCRVAKQWNMLKSMYITRGYCLSWGDLGSECANIHTTCGVLKLFQHTGLGIFSFSAALLVKVSIF